MSDSIIKNYEHFKAHKADETYDEVRLRQVERWKESEMSGDEWRFSWTIELIRKGKVIAQSGAHRLSDAIARLAWFRLTAGESDEYDSTWHNRERVEKICMQPGCCEVATVTLRLKDEYSAQGEGPLPPSPLGQPLRRFCKRHSGRGNCGMEDADSNYEVVNDD